MKKLTVLLLMMLPFVANAQEEEKIYDIKQLDGKPKFAGEGDKLLDSLFCSKFNYAIDTTDDNEDGYVKFVAHIDKNGKVYSLTVVKDTMPEGVANYCDGVLSSIMEEYGYDVGYLYKEPVNYADTIFVKFISCPDNVNGYVISVNIQGDEMPLFPGGQRALDLFIRSNFQMPPAAADVGASGRIYIEYIVNEDGSVSDEKILEDGVGYGCGEEALRVVKLMGDKFEWEPSHIKGCAITIRYRYPIDISNAGSDAKPRRTEDKTEKKTERKEDVIDYTRNPNEYKEITGDLVSSIALITNKYLSTIDKKTLKKSVRGGEADKMVVYVTISDEGKLMSWETISNDFNQEMVNYLNLFLDRNRSIWKPLVQGIKGTTASYKWIITREDIKNYLDNLKN